MLSISNIAWDVSLDDDVATLLNDLGVPHIDVAPPKYFSVPSETTAEQVLTVKQYWNAKGIEPIGMQALLFGTAGLNVFGEEAVQARLLEHLTHICKIGDILGARKLVFGSPRNRDRSHLDDIQTQEMAISFFRRLGDIAKSNNVVVCLEPNPVCYQANFMTNSLDTEAVVRAIDHPHIRMQLDIGAMCINEESPAEIIKAVAPVVHHIHISEPQLAPLNKDNLFHLQAADAIKTYLPNMPMTIEMLTTENNASMAEISAAIELTQNIYGSTR
ncbi:sugar phosphate isomerase/epimerase [Shewanella maritima]|uniref:Sugar phosphate isomerase/epimerase n=1 Tax=Shewanella maritima TaxID=2520507 RepID=A0A411PL70_9GAMM|nr:TIM barrel protein [Shewanella maritima]QBF84283.1 sugar phosphate isomerase/epimerase [Shewanella maritima]